MPGKALLVVRAVVADEALREKFDRWYANDHMPWALKAFRADKAWRCWSASDPSVHYAAYRFPDMDALNERMSSDDMRALVADFDRSFPTVTRTREYLNLVDEAAA